VRLWPCRQVRQDLLSKLITFPTAVIVTFIVGTDNPTRKASSHDQVASRMDVKKPETSAPSKCVDASHPRPSGLRCEFIKTNNLDSSGVDNGSDEVISNGGFANEGSSSLSAKKALLYVKILCFLSFFFLFLPRY